MEDGDTRVMHTLLTVSRTALLVDCTARLALAGSAIGDLEARVVIFGLWRRRRGGRSVLSSLDRCAGGSSSVEGVDLLCEGSFVLLRLLLQLGRLVGRRVCTCGAGGNIHELVKGQDSRLAALPSFT
jgi:hypothetical protein